MNNIKNLMLAAVMLLAGAVTAVTAQDQMMNDDMHKMDTKLPTVVIFRADWCPYCRDLEPAMASWMTDYKDKLNFVVLDITNKTTTEKSRETAKAAGFAEFFDANKEKASLIAIFKDKKEIFKTLHNSDAAVYVKAFDKATEITEK